MIPKRWFLKLAIVLSLIWLVACYTSSPIGSGPTQMPVKASVSFTPTVNQPASTRRSESPTPTVMETSNAQNSELAEPIDTGTIQGAPLFSPDGLSLVVPTSRGIGFYDAQTLAALGLLAVDMGTEYLAFSPDGLLLAAGFRNPANPPDGAILLWTAKDGEFHTSLLGMTFDFSPVQPRLAAVWQESDEATIYSYSFSGAPTDIFRGQQAFFSPTGLLAAGSGGNWRLIDMQSGDTLLSLRGQALAFSSGGKHLALLERGKVHLYHLPDGTPVGVMDGSWEQALQLQFSPDGQSLAGTLSGCPAGEGCKYPLPVNAVWRLSDGKLTLTRSGEDYAPWITFSPNGDRLAAVSSDGKLALWRLTQIAK